MRGFNPSRVRGLYEFQACLGYRVRPCLKNTFLIFNMVFTEVAPKKAARSFLQVPRAQYWALLSENGSFLSSQRGRIYRSFPY